MRFAVELNHSLESLYPDYSKVFYDNCILYRIFSVALLLYSIAYPTAVHEYTIPLRVVVGVGLVGDKLSSQ